MEYNEQKQERVILAGVHRGMRDALWDTTEESIHELGELVKTAGGIVVGEMIQNKADLESATYMGEGKLDELKIAIETLNADMVVFDDELSPVQMRNISDFLEIKVLDRSMLILDIFAMRAKSGEGKLQVELAQLKYRLPRLRGFGVEMSRTGAGIGTRGPGETRLESDRRHIRRRISALEEEIKELKKHRGLIRDRRKIRKLPHHLIEAFKSTLEEAVVADVLLHVIDASGEEMDNQITVVEQVLSDIGAVGKPVVAVFNKCDRLEDYPITNLKSDKCVYISAKHRTNIDKLIEAIADTAPGKKQKIKACIPYSAGSLVNELHENQKVISEEYGENGTVMELMVDAKMYDKIREYIL